MESQYTLPPRPDLVCRATEQTCHGRHSLAVSSDTGPGTGTGSSLPGTGGSGFERLDNGPGLWGTGLQTSGHGRK